MLQFWKAFRMIVMYACTLFAFSTLLGKIANMEDNGNQGKSCYILLLTVSEVFKIILK